MEGILSEGIRSPFLWVLVAGITIVNIFKSHILSLANIVYTLIETIISVFLVYLLIRGILKIVGKIFVKK